MGKFCAIASGTQFIMESAIHRISYPARFLKKRFDRELTIFSPAEVVESGG